MSEDTVSAQEIVPYWNAAVYGVCSYLLGVGLFKAVVITLLVSICLGLRYGSNWVMRGGFVLLTLTVLIWIGVIPPTDQWHRLATEVVNWSSQTIAAMH